MISDRATEYRSELVAQEFEIQRLVADMAELMEDRNKWRKKSKKHKKRSLQQSIDCMDMHYDDMNRIAELESQLARMSHHYVSYSTVTTGTPTNDPGDVRSTCECEVHDD